MQLSVLLLATLAFGATLPNEKRQTSSGGRSSGGVSASPASDKFEDGVWDCDRVPEDVEGVIALDHLDMNGWSSIQVNGGQSERCTDGCFCAYACKPGMAKMQWPDNQPASGESIGGLRCRGGKLYKTSPGQPLCQEQADTAIARNDLNQKVVLCQTVYPGNENMAIPTVVDGHGTSDITVIDGSEHFRWQGKQTSAQYYAMAAGVSEDEGCIWGTPGSNVGNFSPLNLGAGKAEDGKTYLSIFPNPHGSLSGLNYNVEIVPVDGGVINGDCSIVNGRYSGGPNGCTVTVTSGKACFRFF